MPQTLLTLEELGRRRAGRVAVKDLTLSLQAGQVLGLLGVNGAGKSTTLAMIAGALAPDEGRLRLAGLDPTTHPAQVRRLLGWLPERAPLWQELTVAEHLHAHGRLRGLKGAGLRDACRRISARLDLDGLARRVVGVLSQGQRQRVGLACALLHQPRLLVLDEPGNALDPLQLATLREVIREQAAAGTAVILSTHVLTEVTAVCDRVAILHDGRLRYDAPLGRLDHDALERTFMGIATRREAA